MYKERGASSLTTINGVTSGNATITISGYLYWTLVTPHDTTSNTVFSNTNYNNPKIIGPPHTVLHHDGMFQHLEVYLKHIKQKSGRFI